MAITDKFTYVGTPGSATYLASPGYTIGGTSQNLEAWAGWPTGAVHYDIYTVQLDGAKETAKSGSRTSWKAIHNGSGVLSSLQKKGGTDQNYPAGTNTRVIITHSAYRENEIIDGILAHANQDGTLITQAVRDALSLGANTSTGWEVGSLPNVSSVTANGNGSYNVTFASTVAAMLSVGMKLRTTRTVTAPTYMGGLLNGSSQYFTKTSPTGTLASVTDNFTFEAEVMPKSYAAGHIFARMDATPANGIYWFMNASGQVVVGLRNGGAANWREITTYQSLPLNKKTHIAASYSSTGPTTNIYFNGVLVPSVAAANGTSPIVSGAGGDFTIGRAGAWTGGGYFSGYISSVAVFNAVLSAATIRQHATYALTGSETNCIGAWSLNNTLVNQQAPGTNDLTAQGGASFTSGMAPYATDGNDVAGGIYDYALVMKVATTVVTVQVPEGCTIPTSGGVSATAFSTQANPFGWVSDKGRWEVSTMNVGASTATGGAWVNLDGKQLSIPLGNWDVTFSGAIGRNNTAASNADATLSTSSSAETDLRFRVKVYYSISMDVIVPFTVSASVSLSSATTYYALVNPNGIGAGGVGIKGDGRPTYITAVPAGL